MLVGGDGTKYSIEGADFQGGVVGYDNALMTWGFGLQDNMATHAMRNLVSPIPAQNFNQFCAGDVTRDFHAKAKTSSREKCRRTMISPGAS